MHYLIYGCYLSTYYFSCGGNHASLARESCQVNEDFGACFEIDLKAISSTVICILVFPKYQCLGIPVNTHQGSIAIESLYFQAQDHPASRS
jgi:hypothetical protein